GPKPPPPPGAEEPLRPRNVFDQPEAPKEPGADRSVIFVPEAELKAWMSEHEPETHRLWNQLSGEGRHQDANRVLREVNSRMREFKELKERDPKGFEKMME